MMAERGYLDGSRMATVFNMLRPKDLIWPYIVNNYMLGKKPFPFDLLFWNQDSTRMTPANHNFYLREFYHENKLARGQMTIGGVKLDLGKVKLPIYELCAKEDHIAPAKSVFIGSRLFGGPVDLRAGGLGPHRRRHQSARRQGQVPVLDQRQEGGDAGGVARERQGASGLLVAALGRVAGQASGGKVPARTPGAKLGVIEDAPGSYVKVEELNRSALTLSKTGGGTSTLCSLVESAEEGAELGDHGLRGLLGQVVAAVDGAAASPRPRSIAARSPARRTTGRSCPWRPTAPAAGIALAAPRRGWRGRAPGRCVAAAR